MNEKEPNNDTAEAQKVELGTTINGGYGHISVGGWPVLTHRFAYEQANGPIPGGMSVCHRCDNPPCCNPAHLFLGTHSDNMRDMVAKGRNVVPNKKMEIKS